MLDSVSTSIAFVIFIVAAVITWLAGITLTKTTDSLDTRWNIGDAIGGLVLLGVAGSLPEIAVVYSAAKHGHIPVIIGTLIGGLAIQTLLVVIFDFASGKKPLSLLAGNVTVSLETIFAAFMTVIVVAAALISPQHRVFNSNPLSFVLPIAWVLGLVLINKARKHPHFNETAEDASPGRKHHERRAVENHPFYVGRSTAHVVLIFVLASLATLAAGFFLEESGTLIALRLGIGSGIFAATAIALATSLPEISTGLESIFIGDNQLAISDIMGGNAFMLVLFLLGDLVAHQPVISFAAHSDFIFAFLGIAMMLVYAISFYRKWRRRCFRLGWDSVLEILLYIAGAVALTKIK
jgi:cation:H+ antiporter